ncbi:hypothetical protein Kpol_1044p13 [Vanderwaltozyma polyspora DSM 70294]|uniref:Structural maintenance of chromosomes protein 5 n=1 Tax=Vanderwaltozyma polyspora (strain ATCC 22028 / DSM 70294 / BCRC 21397 / CBS 2163 / NBRC 10782 / NRRL Y-8283 / UCD 57-17) TaxID=436907 RepID=A7TP44_VANPO|nr:uncharacterized protein Kpol_1044p13 [Vanderwaltozyma polyspora DSM 70294]EDO15954.1 hypothetical protein Kpol_1044p13 [Vanderwaltozyma polyspora DSM 70294]
MQQEQEPKQQIFDFSRFTQNEEDVDDHSTQPSKKKIKLSPIQYDDYQAGSIIKIKMKNFMTYGLVEYQLCPSFNMIIGPNGSGKSTVVCALGLGLASKLDITGRGDIVTQYIQNGKTSGKIEITLKYSDRIKNVKGVNPNRETVTIKREISIDAKKSNYKINNTVVNEKDVRDIVSKLNIQLDNLCQYLPQERLKDFARLKGEKLLLETIRAVDPALLSDFNEMKELQEEQIRDDVTLAKNKSRIEELKKEGERLKHLVDEYNTYVKIKSDLKLCKDARPYFYINEHKESLRSLKQQFLESKDRLRSFRKDNKPIIAAETSLKQKVISAKERKRQETSNLLAAKAAVKDLVQEINTAKESMISSKGKIKYYKERNIKLKVQIDETTKDLEDKKQAIALMNVPKKEKFNEMESEKNKLITEEFDLKSKLKTNANKIGRCSHNIKTLESRIHGKSKLLTSSDRIRILDSSADLNDVRGAVLTIRSNSSMKAKVLEPPIMTVFVNDHSLAPALAKCVDYNTSKALTITDSEAFDNFGNQLIRTYKVNTRELAAFNKTPPVPRDRLIEWGFDGYLVDFVKGDEKVIDMLCQFCNIHTIPVSKESLNPRVLEKLTSANRHGDIYFKRVINKDRLIVIKKSRYNNKIFTIDNGLDDTIYYKASVLTPENKKKIEDEIAGLGRDIQKEKDEIKNIENENTKLNDEIVVIKRKLALIQEELKKLNSQREKYFRVENEINSMENKLKDLEKQTQVDVSDKIREIESKLLQSVKEESNLIFRMNEKMKKVYRCQKDVLHSDVEYLEALNIEKSIGDIINLFSNKEKELEDVVASLKNELRTKNNTEDYERWKEETRSYTEERKKIIEKYIEKCKDKDNLTVDFIDREISRLESTLKNTNEEKTSALLLENNNKELKVIEDGMPDLEGKLKSTKSQIAVLRDNTEPKIDNLIKGISNKYSQLFTSVGSAGEIKLEKPNNFSNWQVKILVKFRDNESVRELTSQSQSGGEKAVSTALYIISLQNFTKAPFRVVDEINQGMDSRNEKIIHRIMVENACEDNTSQYILVTPKLLTDLYYHEKMRIHCVMAGSWVPNTQEHPEALNLGETCNYMLNTE